VDKDNVFCSSKFWMDDGDVLHILIKDLVGVRPHIELYDKDGNMEDDSTPDVSEITFGYLYNWFAVNDARNMANTGWHVATNAEWGDLVTYLGGVNGGGGPLKETGFTYWQSPNTGATNEVGFNARGGGYRDPWLAGVFTGILEYNPIWNATEMDADNAYTVQLVYSHPDIDYGGGSPKIGGASVRLIKDSTALIHGETGTYTGNDGKVYRTICIDTQEWVADNLAETKYRNGEDIPEVIDNAAWQALLTGAYCEYQSGYEEVKYGLLYNWHAATDARNIANTGWHMPTIGELITLQTYLGGEFVAGGKLKETGTTWWNIPNDGATNEVGFNGRGAGSRSSLTGVFSGLKENNPIWSATQDFNPANGFSMILYRNNTYFSIAWPPKETGVSIRLIKDLTTLSHGQVGVYEGNDGKIYQTICINNQEWLSECLSETKYRDGNDIPEVTDGGAWVALSTGALCAYENNWDNV